MKRTKKRKQSTVFPVEEKIIKNVLCYHKHLKVIIHYMDWDEIVALTHPTFREDLARQNRYF